MGDTENEIGVFEIKARNGITAKVMFMHVFIAANKITRHFFSIWCGEMKTKQIKISGQKHSGYLAVVSSPDMEKLPDTLGDKKNRFQLKVNDSWKKVCFTGEYAKREKICKLAVVNRLKRGKHEGIKDLRIKRFNSGKKFIQLVVFE